MHAAANNKNKTHWDEECGGQMLGSASRESSVKRCVTMIMARPLSHSIK